VDFGDGRLASGVENGTVRLWDLNPGRLLKKAAQGARRNLSADEWKFYLGTRPYRCTFPEWRRGEGVEEAVKAGTLTLSPEP
jgi:hypothetical protein